jgi:uncharacterized membrane protein YoaK (UPF0700 family)
MARRQLKRLLGIAALTAAALAFVAGFVDGDAYLRWHQFAANMTGNTVLFGIASVSGDLRHALVALAPIGAFIAGCAIAQALLGSSRVIPLLVEIVCLCVASFAGWHRWQLALAALAMGIQNTTVKTFDTVEANTSFVTGDYGRIAQASVRLLSGRGTRKDRDTLTIMLPLIVCYVLGAACAAALVAAHIPHALLAVVPFLLVVTYSVRRRGTEAAI